MWNDQGNILIVKMLRFIIICLCCAVSTFALSKIENREILNKKKKFILFALILGHEFNATNYFPENNKIAEGRRHFFRFNSTDVISVDASKYLHTQNMYHSFECTFRLKNSSLNQYFDHWYLFDVQSTEGNRFYLALSSDRKRIIFYADWNKSVSKFEFDNIQVRGI